MAGPSCFNRIPNGLEIWKGNYTVSVVNAGDTVTAYVYFPTLVSQAAEVLMLDASKYPSPTSVDFTGGAATFMGSTYLDANGCGQIDMQMKQTGVYHMCALGWTLKTCDEYPFGPQVPCQEIIDVTKMVDLTVGTQPPPSQSSYGYDCVNGQCVPTTSYVGPYSTLQDCIAAGCKSTTTNAPPTSGITWNSTATVAVIGGFILGYLLTRK